MIALPVLGYSDPDLGVALTHKRPTSFKEYYRLFESISLPEGVEDLTNDALFADYFISGLNPVMIKVARQLQANMGLENRHLKEHPLFSQDSIEDMLDDKRLLLVDYSALEGLEAGEHPDQPKYVYSPIVYLGIPKQGGPIEVIAIQVGQESSEYPLVTPKTGKWDWLVAKTIVKSADINYHEVITHLGLTHLLIDPIVVATYRQLAPQHPLHVLLIPHFEGTIPINALAVKKLLPKGGKVEQLLAGTIDSAYDLLRGVRASYGFRSNFLAKSIDARGVGETSQLKDYPYRDDGLLIWEAIESWVSDYVDLYYTSDKDVLMDSELSNWVKEIIDPQGGRVVDFAPNDQITNKKVLVETLTMILFTASAQHAAVNFPQAKAAAAVYQPLSGYAPAPKKLGLSESEALDFLPPLDRAIKQLHTLTLLGTTYYTKLGDYPLGSFADKRVIPKLWAFQSKLDKIESEIENRNKARRQAYNYLKPSGIPQSINI